MSMASLRDGTTDEPRAMGRPNARLELSGMTRRWPVTFLQKRGKHRGAGRERGADGGVPARAAVARFCRNVMAHAPDGAHAWRTRALAAGTFLQKRRDARGSPFLVTRSPVGRGARHMPRFCRNAMGFTTRAGKRAERSTAPSPNDSALSSRRWRLRLAAMRSCRPAQAAYTALDQYASGSGGSPGSGSESATAGVCMRPLSSFDDVCGLIPQTPTSTAMNTHGMRGPRVHDDVHLSLVNRFYSDHARVCLRWIGRQGRILRSCVTLFHHRSV